MIIIRIEKLPGKFLQKGILISSLTKRSAPLNWLLDWTSSVLSGVESGLESDFVNANFAFT